MVTLAFDFCSFHTHAGWLCIERTRSHEPMPMTNFYSSSFHTGRLWTTPTMLSTTCPRPHNQHVLSYSVYFFLRINSPIFSYLRSFLSTHRPKHFSDRTKKKKSMSTIVLWDESGWIFRLSRGPNESCTNFSVRK